MNGGSKRQRDHLRAPRFRKAMDVVLALAAVAAVGALILDHGGFHLSPDAARRLHLAEFAIVAVFVLDRLVRLVLARDRRAYFRHNRVDFALILGGAAALIIALEFRPALLSAGALYLIFTQVFLLASLVVRGVSINLRLAGSGIPPALLLTASFAILCASGALLLMLPGAVRPEFRSAWGFLDALFTATSATCVTGLVVVNTGAHFTGLGQAVILCLFQAGGLGIMLFGTVLAMLVGKSLSLRGSETLGEMVATDRLGEIGRVAWFVVLTTVVLEACGAISLFPMFNGGLDTLGRPLATRGAVWHSIFHSVSAFCNAGFSLYGNSLMHGAAEGWARPLRDNWQVAGVIVPLIVIGGIGFPVLRDVSEWALSMLTRWREGMGRRRRPMKISVRRATLSLHSKIVLATTAALLVLGTAGLMVLERLPGANSAAPAVGVGAEATAAGRCVPAPGTRSAVAADMTRDPVALRDLRGYTFLREAFFQSVTARTAGFNTVDMGRLSISSKLLVCWLMTIGGSPASTAGGMKTVTMVLLLLAVYSAVRRRSEVEVFRRSIDAAMLGRAITMAVLFVGLVAGVTLLLTAMMPGQPLEDLLFEACSACGTVGLSTGITPQLTPPAKLVIIVAMFAGRVGPLTLLLALTARIRHVAYHYPTENVIIG